MNKNSELRRALFKGVFALVGASFSRNWLDSALGRLRKGRNSMTVSSASAARRSPRGEFFLLVTVYRP